MPFFNIGAEFVLNVSDKEIVKAQNLAFCEGVLLVAESFLQNRNRVLFVSCYSIYFIDFTLKFVDVVLDKPPEVEMLLVSDLPEGDIKIKLEISFKYTTHNSL
jgi:hypothetical protein